MEDGHLGSCVRVRFHLRWCVVTKHLLRGNPRLLVAALPWVVVVVAVKALVDARDWHAFELSPLLAGAIAAEVFILGFLLAGTAGDFKEAERLPGEAAASLESIADECLITHEDTGLPEARTCLRQLVEISRSIRAWLLQDRGLDDVMADLRALNGPFRVFAPAIQAGFTTRLKTEQAAIRKLVIRMDTMRRTSYVAAGYLIAEVTALTLTLVLVLTDLGALAPTLVLVGLITYLLIYLVSLIRDLDNPFEYRNGVPGPADVSLEVLERNEDRLRALLAGLEASVAEGATTAHPKAADPVVPPPDTATDGAEMASVGAEDTGDPAG
jgi:predicted membrane chloride channel (bestrophin family)